MKHTSWPVALLFFLLALIDPVVNRAQVALYPIRENGKWGLMNESGQTVIPATYTAAVPRGSNLVEIRLPSGRGLIDRMGTEWLPAKYAEIHLVRDSLVWFREGARWGYLHLPSGNMLPPIYAKPILYHASPFMVIQVASRERDSAGNEKTLMSVITENALELLPPIEAEIDEIREYPSLLQLTAPDKKVGIWDCESGILLPPAYHEVHPLHGKRFAAAREEGDRFHLIDLHGNELLEHEFDSFEDLENGWIALRKDSIQGLVNPHNQLLIHGVWEDLKILGEEAVGFLEDGLWGLTRVDGAVIFKPRFTDLKKAGNEMLIATLDSGLSWKLEAAYTTKGNTILPLKPYHIVKMKDGPGFAVQNGKDDWTWHTDQGTPTPITGYADISGFQHGYATLQKDTLLGLMDSLGEVLIPIKYSKIAILPTKVHAYQGKEKRVFMMDDEGRILTGNRFILVRGNENYGGWDNNWVQLQQAGWVLFPNTGKYGLKDPDTDSIMIKPRYDQVRLVGNTGLTVVERDLQSGTLYGLVDHSRFRKVIEPVLAEIHSEDYLQANLARVTLANGRRALLTRRGRIIQSTQMRFAGKYAEGKARVMLDGKIKWEDRLDAKALETQSTRVNGRIIRKGLYAYGGSWGFIDRNGKWICPALYDLVTDFENGIALVQKNGKWGAIDSSMKVIVPIEWDFLERMDNNPRSPLIAGRADGGSGYISADGQTIITGPNNDGSGFAEGRQFSGQLAAVKVGEKWGFANRQGRMAIPPIYDAVGDFSEGLAWVRTGRTISIVDQSGKVRETEKGVYRMGEFHDGLAWANASGKFGYLDPGGKWALEPEFLDAGDFCHGLAMVRTKSGRGMVDRFGKEVVKARYQKILPFENGAAQIIHKGKHGFIDSLGQVVVPPRYIKMGPFREGLAQVRSGKWSGFIDRSGEVVIKGQFRDLADFSGGLAAVKVRDRWGYLNHQGEMQIEPRYIVARDFENGRSAARERNFWHLIDTAGMDLVKPFSFLHSLSDFRDGMNVGVDNRGNWMLLDSLGGCFRAIQGQRIQGTVQFQNGIGQAFVDGGWRLYDRSLQPLMSLNFRVPVSFHHGMGKVQFGMKYGMFAPDGEVLLEVKYDRLQKMGPVIQVGEGADIAYIRPDGTWIRK